MNYFIQFLTYFRIFIAPVIFILITLFDAYEWALILFLLASISDYWDGFLARKYKLESMVGEVIDPIADKILTMFLILYADSSWRQSLTSVLAKLLILVVILRSQSERRCS